MFKLFGRTYNDEELVTQGERALAEDPAVNTAQLDINSDKGVVTVTGQVTSDLTKRRALEAVRRWYEAKQLRHKEIVDEIRVI